MRNFAFAWLICVILLLILVCTGMIGGGVILSLIFGISWIEGSLIFAIAYFGLLALSFHFMVKDAEEIK